MTVADPDLLIGDGHEVYYIQSDRRWRVHDPVRLQAVDPRYWETVHRVPQADLLAIELGLQLWPMANDTLLACPDQSAYAADGRALHVIPDVETLAAFPHDLVATLDPADLKLVHDAIRDPVPGVRHPSADALGTDAFIWSIAPLPYEGDPDEPGEAVKKPGVTDLDGVDMHPRKREARP